MSGHGFWSRSAFPGWGSRCVCVGLHFACTPLCSGLGVGACGSLRAPRSFPATFWWGRPWRGAVRGLLWVPPPPPPLLFFFRAAGGGWFSALSCRGFVLSSAACPGLGYLGLCPPFPFRLGCAHVFLSARHFSSGVCAGVSGVSLHPGGRCSGLGVTGYGREVFRCSFGGPSGWRLRCCLAGGLPACFGVDAWLHGCVSVFCLPHPFFSSVLFVCFVFFFLGGSLPVPPSASLSWCTHWLGFGVANRVAVGAFAWLRRAPAPWVGCVMYTLCQVAFPVGLGSGSAGWAGVPGNFVRSWVKAGGVSRVPPPLWCRL